MRREEAERWVAIGRMYKDGDDYVIVNPDPLRRRDGTIIPGGECKPGLTRIRFLKEGE